MQRTALTVLVLLVAFAPLSGSVAGGSPGVAADHDPGTVDCEFPVSAPDASGSEVTVEEEPERVVVLGPSAAQTMWEIGAQDKVVGMPVNQFTAYLEGSESKENVVNAQGQPITERVVGLDPDIVLAPNIVQNDSIESLREAGLTVYRFESATSFRDVAAKTELTGRLVGDFEAAANRSAEMEGTVDAVEDGIEGEESPRVYYPLGSGYTAGSNTFIDDIITSAGGENVAAEAIDGYDVISPEIVATQDPEWLLLQEGFPVPQNDAVNGSTAVREDQIIRVNPNYLNQPAPRTTQVLRTVAEDLHPEAYGQIDFENVENPEPAQCGGTGGSGDEESASAFGDGFTVVGAAVAVALVGLLARRRN
jgi:iron complex transport system substrate-binding protein